jgi:predicted nucleic acid-binding protein
MTELVSPPSLVFDNMLLSHFSLADRLDVLHELHTDRTCYTTHVVREELRQRSEQVPDASLDWLIIERLGKLPEIRCFVKWARLLGAGERDLGEASVFATAELRQAIALCDDQEAVRVARTHGLNVHGTIWMLSYACGNGKLTEVNVANLIDALIHTGMRLPCTGSEYSAWARAHRLLP